MQELAWLIGNDVDLEKAKIDQFFRVPYLEIGPMIPAEMVEMVKMLKKLKTPWKAILTSKIW